ncbi:unnamed protein product, partial [Darwinula stevensoni]
MRISTRLTASGVSTQVKMDPRRVEIEVRQKSCPYGDRLSETSPLVESCFSLPANYSSIERREFTGSSSYDGSEENPLDSLLDSTMEDFKKKRPDLLPHLDPVNGKKKITTGLFPHSLAYYLKILLIICGCAVSTLVHRTLAALLASTFAIAALAAVNERPTLPEIVSWLDMETLALLFGMMIMVAILSESGLFDWIAVLAYQIAHGRRWYLLTYLFIFTAIISAFLDNVTTVLLLTPVTIRLCEVSDLDPVPVLILMVLFSNIGGSGTAIGDPPNVRLDREQEDLRGEVAVWEKAARGFSTLSRQELVVRRMLMRKVQHLQKLLEQRIAANNGEALDDRFRETLEELKTKYVIRDKVLLIKSMVVLVIVLILFCLQP